ncbi:MAG: DUF6599 family protein [Sedimentisphaerales bacterium]|jgi:hypothetical protein
MRLRPGKAGKFESAVGILYLLQLALVVAGLLVIQTRFDMSRFGIAPQSPQSQQGGFLPVGKAETYDTDNLYEKIDGKAPMYQENGFVKLTTQRFASDANAELGFEQCLYDMGNTRNAFSVYSRQKRTDVIDIPDFDATGFGYKTTNSIYIAHGQYYIEMVGFAESDELLNAMKGIAQKQITQLPVDEKDRITEIGIFPPEIVPGSVQLQIIDAYGFDGLTDTWSARYKVNDKTVTIFFSKRSNADEAKKVAKSYNDFLISNGAKVVEANTSVLEFLGSTEIVFSASNFVGGVHEADDRNAALKAADTLSKRLNEIGDKTDG